MTVYNSILRILRFDRPLLQIKEANLRRGDRNDSVR